MQYYYSCIEQLDLAAVQLHNSNPSYARFSLILTDNILELMLHKQCEVDFLRDDLWKAVKPAKPKYGAKLKAKVLGQQFDEKAKFVKKIGKLSDDELCFILSCHRYRNELYHSGIKYNDLVFPLAWYYHDFVCDLLHRLKFSYYGYMWSSRDSISDAVKRHSGANGIGMFEVEKALREIAISLKKCKPIVSKPLCAFLSDVAIGRIEEVEYNLEFLVNDNPGHKGEAEIIEHMQFHDFIAKEYSKTQSELSKCVYSERYFFLVEELKKNWRPKVKSNPLPRWRQAAVSIGKGPNDFKALQKFETLRENMRYFSEIVEDAAVQLDGWIQAEIDRARGK